MKAAPPRLLWWLALGFGLWSSAFVLLYGLHAIGCAYGWGGVALRLVMAGVLAAHLLALGVALARARATIWPGGGAGALIGRVTVWTLWAAILAVVVTFTPGLALRACV